jgi:hypothetical protein
LQVILSSLPYLSSMRPMLKWPICAAAKRAVRPSLWRASNRDAGPKKQSGVWMETATAVAWAGARVLFVYTGIVAEKQLNLTGVLPKK